MAGETSVIAGFGGGLIAHAYLEEHLPADIEAARDVGFERHILRWWRGVSRALGPASSARAVLDIAVAPLLELLRHEPAPTVPESYGLRGSLRSANAVLLVLPWAWPPTSGWRDAIRSGLATGAHWAIITNGRSLRIADCTRSWTRSGIEFDFERLLLSPRGVAVLWALANAGAMSGAAPRTLRSRLTASDAHASRVCRSLSDGVLGALPLLAASLEPGRSTHGRRAIAFDQSLTIVYRVLFLLFAEAHALVPVWNELYREAYTIDALTDRAVRSTPRGLWSALQAISRLAHSGCKAGDLDVTAFNGRLFSPRHSPLIEQRRIPDAVVRDVLLSLATEATRQGRRRISYHDLGVEQLGSVYERVLEYEPGAGGDTLTLSRTSTRRKATGSFYTPRALTEFLVRRTLTPLVEGKSADQILQLRIVDPAMGSGAFLVAACRFLAECCEQAMIRDGQWLDGDATPATRAILRRSVAERCLYGVDLNATAVQLARLSLWLTTLAADRPLTFLDHHLASGNSLIGARLADLARPMRPGRSGKAPPPLPLFDDQLAGEVAGHVLPARLRLAMQPSDSLDAVRNKERTLAQLGERGGAIAKWTAAADAWCAAGLWSDGPAPSPGIVSEWIAGAIGSKTTLPDGQLHAIARARASGRCPPRRVSLGVGVSRSLLWHRGASERRRRLRCGAWQPALGHVARRYRVIVATLGHASDDRGAVAILPLVAVVSAPGQRASQQLPIVRGARAVPRQARRSRRPDPAVGDRDRSRERVAAPASVRSDLDRHLARIRQPRADLSDSSQHAIRGAVDDHRRLHRDTAVPLWHCRSGSARSRGSPHRAAVDRAQPASRPGARST